MTDIIRPFRGLRATAESAPRVAAPPYDVMNTEEARALVGDNSDSFLHVSMPEIDFPPGTDPHSAAVHAAGRATLDRLVAEGLLQQDPAPSLYLYRVTMGDHVQLGLVAAASIAAYRDGRIKLHEHTKAAKVEDRARNADALDAHTGTLFLTYRAEAALDAELARLSTAPPAVIVDAEDGVRHELWVVAEPELVAELADRVNAMPAVYMADGHHRSAAAEKLAEWRTAWRADGQPVAAADWFLAVLFPHTQVQILPYNRLVSTLGEGNLADLLAALGDHFIVESAAAAVVPDRPGVFGLYAEGAWHRLAVKPESVPGDPVGRLDINLLEAYCLRPLLGITDQRTDSRIDFVGGIRGVEELERRVDAGEAVAAFAFYRTGLDEVLAVADAGEIMPPKCTWFEPKLRDGLIVLKLED
jgi:uncharacterized protein (DUF1015 family)